LALTSTELANVLVRASGRRPDPSKSASSYHGTVELEGGPRILIVDDDEPVRALLRRYLTLEGYKVCEVADGPAALQALRDDPPDIVLLDVVMPGEDGFDVLASLRRTSNLPVIMVSGRDDVADRVMGLRLGADDYVVKPFSPLELTARIDSLLRRAPSGTRHVLRFDGLEIDRARRTVTVADQEVEMPAREFDLLAFLAASAGTVFTREELLRDVWASSSDWQDVSTVTEHVRRIRRRVERDPDQPRWIRTARGVGYRFEP